VIGPGAIGQFLQLFDLGECDPHSFKGSWVNGQDQRNSVIDIQL
jgi:hypothetical protein